MRILLLGSNGQLGRCLVEEFYKTKYDLLITNKSQIDITNIESTKAKILKISPNIIINATAYNAVDKAENEISLAKKTNGYAIKNIAEICKKMNSIFIHVSTDYVFDGKSNQPYTELSKVNPLGVYGKSKLMGEEAIIISKCDHIIIRTSWVFSEHGNNFLKTMIKLGSEKDQLDIVADQFGCPTYARDLAIAIISIIKQIEKKKYEWGIYNFSGESSCTWHDFAEYIFKIAKKNNMKIPKKINRISMYEYNNIAKRPQYSALDCSKIYKYFNIQPCDWKKGIESALSKIEIIS